MDLCKVVVEFGNPVLVLYLSNQLTGIFKVLKTESKRLKKKSIFERAVGV
jgi:hypothetical protein